MYFLKYHEDVLCVLRESWKVTFLIHSSSVSFLKMFTNLKYSDSSRHNVPEMLGSSFILQMLQFEITLLLGVTPCNLLDTLHKTALFLVTTEGISHVTFLCSQQNERYSVN